MTFIILHLAVWSFAVFSLLVWLSKFNPMRIFTPIGMAMTIAGQIIGVKTIGLILLVIALFRNNRA
jgi:hypothetical protein